MALSKIGSAGLASGAVSPAAVSDQANTSTGYLDLPAGTTAQRPGTPAAGQMRWNTSNSEFEFYDGSAWRGVDNSTAGQYSVEYLVVAGGGGGGGNGGGGGGAGGL